jgi:MFS family permease
MHYRRRSVCKPLTGPAAPFRALAHRNFRLYLGGQAVSVIGTWMQQVALAWLTFELTASPLWLGVVVFAGQIPALFVTPVAGGIIDRCDRFRLLLVIQTIALAQALGLAVLTLTGVIAVWHVVALSLVAGAVTAFDIPTRHSLLVRLVDNSDDLPNAIALNSSVFNGARILGPSLAGVLLAVAGTGVCFLINAASYLAVLVALLMLRLPKSPRAAAPGPLLGGIRAGLAYAWNSESIRALLLLIGVFNMAGLAEMTLLPVVSTAVLHGGSSTLALLSAAAGTGAFAAAASLAARPSVRGLERWIRAMPIVYGVGLATLSFAGTTWAAALLLVVTGFALLLMTAAANTILQTVVEEDKRGRILSLYTTAVTGLAPLGGLAAGLVAHSLGVALTLRLIGLGCLAGGVLFAAYFRTGRARQHPPTHPADYQPANSQSPQLAA